MLFSKQQNPQRIFTKQNHQTNIFGKLNAMSNNRHDHNYNTGHNQPTNGLEIRKRT